MGNAKIISCLAECMDCGKTFQNYNDARLRAKIHARVSGHKVTGEVAIAFSYDGRKKGAVKKGS